MNKHFVEHFVSILGHFGVKMPIKCAHSFLRRAAPRKIIEVGLTSGNWRGYAFLDALAITVAGSEWPRKQLEDDGKSVDDFYSRLDAGISASGSVVATIIVDKDAAMCQFLTGLDGKKTHQIISAFSEQFDVDLSPAQFVDLVEGNGGLLRSLHGCYNQDHFLSLLADELSLRVNGVSWPTKSAPAAIVEQFLKSFASQAAIQGYIVRATPAGPFSFLALQSDVDRFEGDKFCECLLSEFSFEGFNNSEKLSTGLYQANRLLIEEIVNSPIEAAQKILSAVIGVSCDDTDEGLLNLGGSTYIALPETILAHLGLAAGLVLSGTDESSALRTRVEDMLKMAALSYGAKSGLSMEGVVGPVESVPVSSRDFRYLVPAPSDDMELSERDRVSEVMRQIQAIAAIASEMITQTTSQVGNVLIDAGFSRCDEQKHFVQPETLLTLLAMTVGAVMAQISNDSEFMLDTHWKNVRGMIGAGMGLVGESEELPDNVVRFPGT